ncbi:ABC transporter ATP-binding protein [Thermodesulforhabdus norvegica]|uniref:ABC-2 type transport system ATP-binding protein n=1 Tax=Thermodesulforhabdus norvegica TaxID=39841 RepID=A0A1I4S849_9BACT|nr:ATP-binding cassette domain-containing protein [Thermodesulforhabdus norvegica]SFM60667.1 ABC-2 type transport system ATP-binding protein [Thermodesulforhabdus norvegica]
MSVISVKNLRKYYEVHYKEPGVWGSIKSLISRKYRLVKAVDNVSFEIERGEIVGFLGPNGAGKTTTLKVLAGLLYPTEGTVSVLGYTPFERHPEFLKKITLVMGQKNQLIWDLPPMETFILNKTIYELSEKEFSENLQELTELLDLNPLLKKQVRKLSLGERMKCELTAALLHRPSILFLDEPTIGLDVTMQQRIHKFIREYNSRHRATVLLTSHYMQDVVALCTRILIINEGRILYDGDLNTLSEKIAPYKILRIHLSRPATLDELSPYGLVEHLNTHRAVLRVSRSEAPATASNILKNLPIHDLTIEEPPIEDVIARVFTEGKVEHQ